MKAIIFGYPGIGKSTVARNDKDFIDLESSLFKTNGRRNPDWFMIYTVIGIHLAYQDRIVFMSTHPQTREYIKDLKESLLKDGIEIIIVYPDISLKDFWEYKVNMRYEKDPTPKNLSALNKVRNNFEKDISDLESDIRFKHLVLKDKNYILDNEIKEFLFKLSLNKYERIIIK